jgi:hypothetical protein
MKKVYGEHNVFPRTGQKKDFTSDSQYRLSQMQQRTRGKSATKKQYLSQQDFVKDTQSGGKLRLDGYQLIGDLVFVPTGTWDNALRARAIVEADFKAGIIPVEPKFILLQYGGTLQVCSYKKMSETQNLPQLKSGKTVNDLGVYMTELLSNFQTHLGYYEADTSIGQDEITVSGGHGGIGSISNIFGTCRVAPFQECRFIDMIKNKIISDLSGVNFDLRLVWSEPSEGGEDKRTQDYKVIGTEDVTKLDKQGNIIKNENYEYQLVDKLGQTKTVSKEDFIKAGQNKAMKVDRKSLMTIDTNNKKIIAKFEGFKGL